MLLYGKELAVDYGDGKVCPELRWGGRRYWCALIMRDDHARSSLGVGMGCFTLQTVNSDRANVPPPENCGLKVKRCTTKKR